MKYTTISAALLLALGLSACEKTVVTPPQSPAPAPAPTVVPVPVPVPGPPGAPGPEGAKGEPGKPGGSTVVIVPPAEPEKK